MQSNDNRDRKHTHTHTHTHKRATTRGKGISIAMTERVKWRSRVKGKQGKESADDRPGQPHKFGRTNALHHDGPTTFTGRSSKGFRVKKKQTNKKQWWVTDWFFSFQACFLVSLALKPVEVLWLVGSYGVSRDWPGTSPTGLDFGRVFFYYYASSLRRWQRVVTHRRFEGGKQRTKSPQKK